MVPRLVHMRLSVQYLREARMMVVGAVGRVSEQHGFERRARTLVPCAYRLEVVQMAGDLSPVPGGEDVLRILEIFVERGPADTGLGGNTRHCERVKTLGRGNVGGAIHDRVSHGRTVRFNRVVPELGHYRAV